MWPSALPRPRNARPSRRPTSASPKPGAWISGGASSPRSARNRASARTPPVELDEGRRVVLGPARGSRRRTCRGRPTASRRGRPAAARTRAPRARRATARASSARARGRRTAAGDPPCGRAPGPGRPGRAPRSPWRRRSGRGPRGPGPAGRPWRDTRRPSGRCGRRRRRSRRSRRRGSTSSPRQATFRPRARRSSSAASRPFAPIRPPPGCVDEPDSHRSRIGVLNRA